MNIFNRQREDDIQRLLDTLTASLRSQIKCCPNCLHFDNVRETCDKADNKHPPAKVIAFGCETFNGIPPF